MVITAYQKTVKQSAVIAEIHCIRKLENQEQSANALPYLALCTIGTDAADTIKQTADKVRIKL